MAELASSARVDVTLWKWHGRRDFGVFSTSLAPDDAQRTGWLREISEPATGGRSAFVLPDPADPGRAVVGLQWASAAASRRRGLYAVTLHLPRGGLQPEGDPDASPTVGAVRRAVELALGAPLATDAGPLLGRVISEQHWVEDRAGHPVQSLRGVPAGDVWRLLPGRPPEWGEDDVDDETVRAVAVMLAQRVHEPQRRLAVNVPSTTDYAERLRLLTLLGDSLGTLCDVSSDGASYWDGSFSTAVRGDIDNLTGAPTVCLAGDSPITTHYSDTWRVLSESALWEGRGRDAWRDSVTVAESLLRRVLDHGPVAMRESLRELEGESVQTVWANLDDANRRSAAGRGRVGRRSDERVERPPRAAGSESTAAKLAGPGQRGRGAPATPSGGRVAASPRRVDRPYDREGDDPVRSQPPPVPRRATAAADVDIEERLDDISSRLRDVETSYDRVWRTLEARERDRFPPARSHGEIGGWVDRVRAGSVSGSQLTLVVALLALLLAFVALVSSCGGGTGDSATQNPVMPAPTAQAPTTPTLTTPTPTTQAPVTPTPTTSSTQDPTTQDPTTQDPTTRDPTTQSDEDRGGAQAS